MKDRKSVFFYSDPHFGHANAIVFDKRPFTDLEDMHRSLVSRFNATVPIDGVTYFLGDIGMCGVDKMKEILDRLNGTKILIVGNHDRAYNSMYNAGFHAVMNSATIYIANERVTLSHCPMMGILRENTEGMRGAIAGENWHGESKNSRYSVKDEGQFHLHGHLHSSSTKETPVKLDRQWDIGVCGNGYRPVSISEVESWITKYKKAKG